MARLVRMVLLLVLAVALPAQGIAAATMNMCGTHGSGHDQAPTGSGGPHHDPAPGPAFEHRDGVRHVHGDGLEHEHGGASGDLQIGSHVASGHAHAHAGPDKLAKHGFHKCSVCASCCVGVAVPSAAFAFEPIAMSDSVASLAVRSIAAVVPKGLERPPRSILA